MSSDSQFPSYPDSPGSGSPQPGSPQPATPVAAEVPTQVSIAFWLYLAVAALNLIELILSLATVGAAKDDLQHQLAQRGQHLSDAALNAAIGAAIGFTIVVGLLFVAAYVVFPLFLRRGAGWARIVLLIVTIITLLHIASGYGTGALSFVVAAIATVLVFLRPASEYFRAVRARKAGTVAGR